MIRRLACVVVAALALAAEVFAQQNVPEPDGYRTDDYRAPVPATLAGVRVLATAEAETIWRAGKGAFIDVLPRAPKPQNLPAGTVWRDKPRLNIPGSIWLPDTGYGKLAETTEAYLRRGLEGASGGNKAALLVIYCQENCWMSWNAAKRVCPTAIATWPGIPTAPKAGSAPACRSLKRSLSRGRVKKRRFTTNEETASPRWCALPVRYSISCWITRLSANSRWSMAVGTSQTNFTTRCRSSKIRVCQTS